MSAPIVVADSLLRAAGGRTVLLHMPAPAIPGDLGEQLGLAIPEFQDVPLGPAVFRKVRPRIGTPEQPKEAAYELLVSASAVLGVVGSLGFQAADVLFAHAAGVVVDGALLGIVSVTADEAFGSVYLYRLGLRGAVKDFI
jgi:hypothetical protein